MAVTQSFSNIWSSVIPQDQNVGCELHKEVEVKAYRMIKVALRAVYYFPFIKNNPVYNFLPYKTIWQNCNHSLGPIHIILYVPTPSKIDAVFRTDMSFSVV